MKKVLFAIAATILLFSSCKTSEKVLYFQDITDETVMPAQALQPLTYQPGDKLSIIVTSNATPEAASNYNLPIVTMQAGTSGRAGSNQISYYTVDQHGNIEVPGIGTIKVGGLNRTQVAQTVQEKLRNGLLNDAVVTVNSYDQYITVLGEVKNPGRIQINRDNITILEALGQVGDLTIQARRDQILVLRQEGSETKPYYVDIRSKDIINSPVYNLRQNDVIVVKPNRVRMGQSTNNDNSVRAISTWLSVSSVLISLGILIFH